MELSEKARNGDMQDVPHPTSLTKGDERDEYSHSEVSGGYRGNRGQRG